jgi:hypothetical protein
LYVRLQGEAPPEPPSREETEIRKMDRLLALSDAKITIATPVPGQQQKKAGAVAAASEAAADGGVPAGEGAAAE